jgi:Flp pilus assembly protein TadG
MNSQDASRPENNASVDRHTRIWLHPFQQIRRFCPWLGRNNELAQSECGSSLIEFALSFSAFMAFVFTLMELCLAFYTYGMISESAREATRYAIVHGSTCHTSLNAACAADGPTVSAYAKAVGLPNVGGGTLNVTTTFLADGATVPDGSNVPGHRVHVDITYVFPIRLPFVPRKSLSLDSSSEMVILQ